jgi:hypothetical protein
METAFLKALVVSLVAWINLHTGYEIPAQQPEVVFVPQVQLARMACTGPCPILAWTPRDPRNVIYLVEGLDLEANVCERAVLVHELVHRMQEHAGAFAELAPAARHHMREMEALSVQKTYLAEHGRKLMYTGAFGVMQLSGPYC